MRLPSLIQVVSMYYSTVSIIIRFLSTCPPHTDSGCGEREAHIDCSMVSCKMAASVTGTTLRTTGPVPADSRQ